jgi:hypothetical protein
MSGSVSFCAEAGSGNKNIKNSEKYSGNIRKISGKQQTGILAEDRVT